VKISKKQQNAQNAHLVDNISSREQIKDNKMKLTGKQYRKLVEEKGKEVADATALVLGVATQRIGKMKYAPRDVKDAWDSFQMIVGLNLDIWNDNLPEGVATIKKVDLNIKK
jgi:hypothetical protein